MHTLRDIAVDDNFVIHVLDHRQSAITCSQALTPLPDGFRQTLWQYLRALLRPESRRKRFGQFKPDSKVLQEYRRIRNSATDGARVDPVVFLDASQHLATLLFEAMRSASSNGSGARPGEITPGDLLVGLFYDRAREASSMPYLFLIKVELEAGLQRQVRLLESGGIQTVLTPCTGLLPKLTAEHVHKTALIQWRHEPTSYDVLMTDPQGGKPGVAKFFAEAFLQTEPFHTPDEQAEMLFMRTYSWVTEHEESLSPQEQTEVLQSVRSLIAEHAVTAEPLSPRDLVVTLPLTQPRPEETVQALRQSFQETLTAPEENGSGIPLTRELELNMVPAKVAQTRLTYQLDDGVRLSGDQAAIERLFQKPPHRVGEATEFTIRTKTFRPVW